MKRFLLSLFALLLLGCNSTFDSSVPDWPVYLELDLTYEDRDLKAIQAYKLYTPTTINQATEKTGFGGVLVYHGLSSTGTTDAYYAFDAACPVEHQANVRVEVDDDAVYAVCPRCGSKFELLNGIGNPVEGPATEGLKQYYVDKQGEKLYIRY